ncbi:MAG: glycosyltransferase family 2 protein [Prevotella sp.]|nr:glycosyltransferase family 2 protein [Prevotella sp.]
MKVSVIVPVYNTKDYLTRCVDSLLCQSFSDFELLLIDDGSTDGSSELCDAFQAKDSRVRVFHQQNGGVSAARNYGVQQAQGEWICYVDSDDEVRCEYLQDMVSAVDAEDLLVMGNISDPRLKGFLTEDVSLQGQEMVRYLLSHHILNLSGPVAKLFNRNVLLKHDIHFPTGIHYAEDMIYYFRYLNHVSQVALRQSENYLVTMREGSLSRGYYPFEAEYQCFQYCLAELTTFVGRLGVSSEETTALVWRSRTSDIFLHSIKSLYAPSNGYSREEQMRRLREIPADYYKHFGQGFQPDGFSSAIIKYLVAHRMFTILLIMGSMYERALHKKKS